MKLEPELLQHPKLPRPLHGVNPRTIKGQTWWNKTRQDIYAEREYHCFACGVHKSKSKLSKWLECHEDYSIDYKRGIMHIERLVALCPTCHKFIHCERLAHVECDYIKGKVVNHGYNLLLNAGLCPSYALMTFIKDGSLPEPYKWNPIKHNSFPKGPDHYNLDYDIGWNDWRLEFEGKQYEPIYKSFAEWEEHYSKTNKESKSKCNTGSRQIII